jgi:Transcriptional activator, adenine-specific DNA methyltransferase
VTLKKYQVIYADPPWSYSNFQGKGKSHGDVSAHYKTMSLEDMKGMAIPADNDCIIFMWATFPNLPEALELLSAWGFQYKTVGFVWVKTRGSGLYSGLGFYTNSNAEICLIGRKGKFNRQAKNVKQIIVSPLGRHSEKSLEIRDRIVQLCGDVPRIELFAREKADGWDAWGNEVESDIELAV